MTNARLRVPVRRERRFSELIFSSSALRGTSKDMRHIAANIACGTQASEDSAGDGVPWSLVRPRLCSCWSPRLAPMSSQLRMLPLTYESFLSCASDSAVAVYMVRVSHVSGECRFRRSVNASNGLALGAVSAEVALDQMFARGTSASRDHSARTGACAHRNAKRADANSYLASRAQAGRRAALADVALRVSHCGENQTRAPP